jgi:hypothetical protein
MPCRSCQSERQRALIGEMNIHFLGLTNLDKPTVWALPELVVCLNCGFTEFRMEENALRTLVRNTDSQDRVR